MRQGKYVAFEGVVGSGKTTQSKLLVEKLKVYYPKRKILLTKEPGGSEIADQIRRVVQGMDFAETMNPVCEAYLYAASRAQTLRNVVLPTLEADGIVVADRSVYSSLANQGYGRGLGEEVVWEINKVATMDLLPDLVIFLDTDLERALSGVKDFSGDKFEMIGKNYHQKVREGYLELVGKHKELVLVDSRQSIEEVSVRIWNVVEKHLQ